MKVAHVVPTLHPGGPEIGLVDLAEAAPEAGLELLVVGLATAADTSVVSELRRRGVPVAELGLAPWDPRAVGRLTRALREREARVMHTHLAGADVVGGAAGLRLRMPVVSTLHHVEQEPADRGDRFRRSARILARQRFTARTIAISRVQREWYRGLGGPAGDIDVVPNGVVDPGPPDPVARERVRAGLGVRPDETLAVCSGPMRRDGGQELVLDAVEQIGDDVPLVVAMAGDGPLRPWLESRTDANPELRDQVRFVQRHHEPAALLAAADVVVHASREAALPTVVLRAMAAGRAIVATRVGGIPELVTPATGVLTPLQPGPVADALGALATSPDTRDAMGAAARARYLAEFEAGIWAERLRGVYENVLTPARTS